MSWMVDMDVLSFVEYLADIVLSSLTILSRHLEGWKSFQSCFQSKSNFNFFDGTYFNRRISFFSYNTILSHSSTRYTEIMMQSKDKSDQIIPEELITKFFGYEYILTWHWHCFIVKRKLVIINKQTTDYIQSPNLPAANQTKPSEEVDKTNPLGAVSYFL